MCGLLIIDNCNHQNQFPDIQLPQKHGSQFSVKEIRMDNTLLLESENQKQCNMSLKNLTLPITPYLSFDITSGSFSTNCSNISQVNKTPNSVEFVNLVTASFYLHVNVTRDCSSCYRKGATCQTHHNGNFHCSNVKPGMYQN